MDASGDCPTCPIILAHLFRLQFVGVLAAMVWSALGTWAIFTFMRHEGLRVRGSAEELGVCLLVCCPSMSDWQLLAIEH